MSRRDRKKARKSIKDPRTPAVECPRCGEWYSPGDLVIARPHIKKTCKLKENK